MKIAYISIMISVTLLLIFPSVISEAFNVTGENDFVSGTFSDMQLNLGPNDTTCNHRYTDIGYEIAPAGENGLSACKRCNGVNSTVEFASKYDADNEGVNLCAATCKACRLEGYCGTFRWQYASTYPAYYNPTSYTFRYCQPGYEGGSAYYSTGYGAPEDCVESFMSDSRVSFPGRSVTRYNCVWN